MSTDLRPAPVLLRRAAFASTRDRHAPLTPARAGGGLRPWPVDRSAANAG
jgi:hypothetical protein